MQKLDLRAGPNQPLTINGKNAGDLSEAIAAHVAKHDFTMPECIAVLMHEITLQLAMHDQEEGGKFWLLYGVELLGTLYKGSAEALADGTISKDGPLTPNSIN